jgi:hypothetical protein
VLLPILVEGRNSASHSTNGQGVLTVTIGKRVFRIFPSHDDEAS